MAVTAFASGTKTAEIGVEHPLPVSPFVNESGTYVFQVDTQNMAAGDVLEIRAYARILSGGTTRVAYVETYYGAQVTDDKIKVSVPISTDLAVTEGVKFTLKQTAGSGREYPYKVLKFS